MGWLGVAHHKHVPHVQRTQTSALGTGDRQFFEVWVQEIWLCRA